MIVPIPSKPTLHDLVRIGDTVDVIVSFDGQESRTIVDNVRVLAVDVFINDYPTTSGAMRGGYKAPPVATGGGNPPSPAQATSQPNATPAPGQPTPTPTPTPAPTPKPLLLLPSTLEVTPDQANRISLAMNSGGVMDFLLVPRALPSLIPGTSPEVQAVAVTRPQIAPYAESKKASGAVKSAPAARVARGNSGGEIIRYDGPPIIPMPEIRVPGMSIIPAQIMSKPTYEIPVFADSKPVRTDVVLKPQSQ